MGAGIGAKMRAYRKLSGNWVLMKNIKDLSRPKPRDEADVSTRGSYPWKATLPTFRDWSADWNMNYDEEDADFLALKAVDDADDGRIELAFSRGDITVNGTIYFHVPEAAIFKFDIDEPMTNGVDVAVTVKNASTTNPPGWKIVGEEAASSSSSSA